MIEKKIDNIDLTYVNNKPEFDFSAFFELHSEKKSPEFITFLEWFVGYVDGNANISIIQNKNYPNSFVTYFRLFSKNLEILQHIQKELGFGTIYTFTQKDKGTIYAYYISDKENINKIMRILNGNAMLNYIIKQIQYWHEKSTKYTEPKNKITLLPRINKISLNNGWLSGFLDADGGFGAILRKSKTCKSGFMLSFLCAISKKNEVLVLNNIKTLFNSKSEITKQSSKSINVLKWQIQSMPCFAILVEYLKKFPIKTKNKKLSYENWKKLLPYGYQKNLAPVVKNKKKFEELKKEIKAINSHSGRSPHYKKDLNLNKEQSE